MKTAPVPCFAIAILVAAPAHAMSGNMLKTMPHGVYECALPGDASGPAWRPVDGLGFIVSGASSYRSEAGFGTYLLKGKTLTFTRGPKKGERYVRTGDGALQKLSADGSRERLRCVRIARDH